MFNRSPSSRIAAVRQVEVRADFLPTPALSPAIMLTEVALSNAGERERCVTLRVG
jgi:hypothetical protein